MICGYVFAYALSRSSREAAHFVYLLGPTFSKIITSAFLLYNCNWQAELEYVEIGKSK